MPEASDKVRYVVDAAHSGYCAYVVICLIQVINRRISPIRSITCLTMEPRPGTYGTHKPQHALSQSVYDIMPAQVIGFGTVKDKKRKDDVAEILRLSYENTLMFIRTSGVEYIKTGRQYRVPNDKFRAFISKNLSKYRNF